MRKKRLHFSSSEEENQSLPPKKHREKYQMVSDIAETQPSPMQPQPLSPNESTVTTPDASKEVQKGTMSLLASCEGTKDIKETAMAAFDGQWPTSTQYSAATDSFFLPTEMEEATGGSEDKEVAGATQKPQCPYTLETMEESVTETPPNHSERVEQILQIFKERHRMALEIYPLQCKRRSHLYATILQNPAYLMLLLGTSRFLMKTGRSLNLSMATICTALVYLNRFYEFFSFEQTERKFVAAACILLAWKYREDTEGERNTRKLLELPRMIYRVIYQNAQAKGDLSAPSSSEWILQDNGVALTKIRERIKLYEIGLLRSIQYFIGPFPTPFPILHSYCKRFLLIFAIGSTNCNFHDTMAKLKHRTTLLVLDCYKAPLCLEYSIHELVVACTWKAAILLNLFYDSFHEYGRATTKISTAESPLTQDTHSTAPIAMPNQFVDASLFDVLEKKMDEFLNSLNTKVPIHAYRIRLVLQDIRHIYSAMNALDSLELGEACSES